MLNRLRKKKKARLKALNEITINTDAIKHNYRLLQWVAWSKAVFPVLKSNAYGHGLKQMCQILKPLKLHYICVDSFPEYQIVRDFAWCKALILGETFHENYKYYDHKKATVCVYNLSTLEFLIASKKSRTVHLFLNTGMNREWFQAQQLEAVSTLLEQSALHVEWILTHFACADEEDNSMTHKQIDTFKAMIDQLWLVYQPQYIYCANSWWTVKVDDEYFTAVRWWLALYGYSPLASNDSFASAYEWLVPALNVYSTVITTQRVRQWQHVSYGAHWEAKRDTTIGILPFGYHEGLPRSLSWKDWLVSIDGLSYPIIGTICMNMCCVDLGDSPVQQWDKVTIISSITWTPNTLWSFADCTQTIVYESLVRLSPTMRRTILY